MVAQLRMIFVPNYVNARVPRSPLVYIQPFKFASGTRGSSDAGINMYRLIRDLRNGNTRGGLIVPLNQVWRPVELIPRFGRRCNRDWTCDSAVELAKDFYLNCFSDKSTYIEVY